MLIPLRSDWQGLVVGRVSALGIRGRIDQRDACAWVEATMQMTGLFGDDDFEGWPDVPFDQVAAMRRRVSLAENRVRMHFRLTVLQRDVAHHRKRFDLLIDRYAQVLLRGPVEVRDH